MKDLNEYLPSAIKKNWEIVCPTTGKPLQSAGPIFSCGVHDAVNAREVSEAKMEALFRKKHPMIRKRGAEVSSKTDNSKKVPEGK